jgi:3-methyladenine DNA glycosylase AlkD
MLQLVQEIELQFQLHSNSEYALKCSAYLRNRFSFYGIQSQKRKEIQKQFYPKLNEIPDTERWDFIIECWAREEREWQYLAIDWMNSWKKKSFIPSDIYQLEKLIIQKSWWDSVDAIASNILGEWIKCFPKEFQPILKDWRSDDNFWLHRSSLIFQLKYKNEVDTELLEDLIHQYKTNNEFFIQKAIGWSLRQLSKTNPERVKSILIDQEIKGLALREASKYLP